ncbi:MAG: hypothetical protein GY771_10610 [bacterium]|nr:hypothetical protein [bacterium]
MKNLPLLILIVPVLVYGSSYTWDQLVSGPDDWSDTPIDFTRTDYSWYYWVTDDFIPDNSASYSVFALHYFYERGGSSLGVTAIEIFEGSPNTAPLDGFFLTSSDNTEIDTEWTFDDKKIWLGEFNFEDRNVNVSAGTTYWTAIRMETSDTVFAIMQDTIHWNSAQHFYTKWTETGTDMSMSINPPETGIESASLGEIKAAFK